MREHGRAGLVVVVGHGVQLVFGQEEKGEHGIGEIRSRLPSFDVHNGRDSETHLRDFGCKLGIAGTEGHLGHSSVDEAGLGSASVCLVDPACGAHA